MKPTLGQILRMKLEAQDLANQLDAESKAKLAKAQQPENDKKVADYFDVLKGMVAAAIKNGNPAVVSEGTRNCSLITELLGFHRVNGANCMSEGHRYHNAWKAFVEWARSEELAVRWVPGHEDSYDAAGLPHHHWQTLTIALPDA
jgi:hypothetical protein